MVVMVHGEISMLMVMMMMIYFSQILAAPLNQNRCTCGVRCLLVSISMMKMPNPYASVLAEIRPD